MSPALRQVCDGVLGLLLFLAPGAACASLLPVFRKRRWPARHGYAWLLGVTWVAGSSWAASHCLGWQLRRGVILPLAMLPLAAAIAARFTRKRATNRQEESFRGYSFSKKFSGALPVLAFLLCSFITLGLFADVLTSPVYDWDGVMTWGTTARFMRAERSVNANVLRNERYLLSHPSYPALMPVAQVALVEVLGTNDDERLPRMIYAGFFPAFLLILYDGIASLAGRKVASLAVLIPAALPVFYLYEFGGSSGNYSDFPLACFAGGGALVLCLERRDLSGGIGAGIFLAGAVLTKNEGIMIVGFVLAAALLAAASRKRQPAGPLRQFAPPIVAAGLVALAFVFLHSWQVHVPKKGTPSYVVAFRNTTLPAAVSNLIDSGKEVVPHLVEVPLWGYFWLAFPALLALGWRNVRRRVPWVMTAALAPLLVMASAYAVTPASYGLVNATAHRFLIQAAVPLFLIVGVAFRKTVPGAPASPQAIAASS